MKALAVSLALLCLCGATRANAGTDESRFLGLLKSYGVTPPPGTKSRKPCLCVGGTADRRVGGLVVFKVGASWVYECAVLGFNESGQITTTTDCIESGGQVVLIDK